MSDPQKPEKLLTKQYEQANFNRDVNSLMRHLQEQRPVLSFEKLNDQQVDKARELARSFVMAETGPDPARHIYDSCEANILALGRQAVPLPFFSGTSDLSELHTDEQVEFFYLILETLFKLALDCALRRERSELAKQLRDRASDYIELLGGEPWSLVEAPTSEPHFNDKWLHEASAEPPAEFYRENCLTGTKTEVGFAIRHANLAPVKTERALRDYLKKAASAKTPRVWCRATLTADIDTYFRDAKALYDAKARLKEYPQRKPEEVGESRRKSTEVSSMK